MLDTRIRSALVGAIHFGRRHRTGIVVAIVTLLGGFGITAVAVAPLMPDAALLPQRTVVQAVQPQGIAEQVEALAALDLALVRNEITRGSDTIESLLGRLGVRDAGAASFIRANASARQLLEGRGGKMVQARTDASGALTELVARYPAAQDELRGTHFTRLRIHRGSDGVWQARIELAPFAAQTRLASGVIHSSLFAATDASAIPDSVALQLAEMFSTDIDFHRELRKGDTFSVVYESLSADGEPVAWNEGAGRVLAAQFVNDGRAHHAIWFQGSTGKGGYYGLDGKSKRRAFLASPLAFSRVTSGFAMRFHPLQKTWRQHLGVDYGAPTGTPVRGVGDGVVEFAGWQNGYGNVVQLRHANDKSTLYAHLSRIDVRKGQRVEQGQRIGAVGSTGWSTGPHLHFEFRHRGQHQDPLRVAKGSEAVALDSASLPRFAELAQQVRVKLDIAETLAGRRMAAE